MVIGSFYFRLTSNGNLLGEYTNNQSTTVVTESADLRGKQNESFVGEYQTTWFDGSGQTMLLTINLKNVNLNILHLKWSVNETTYFVGEGFINDGILLGWYCDGELNSKIMPLLTH